MQVEDLARINGMPMESSKEPSTKEEVAPAPAGVKKVIRQKVVEQQHEQVKVEFPQRNDKDNIMHMGKCMENTRQSELQSNPKQQQHLPNQKHFKPQPGQTYRIPRKIKDNPQNPSQVSLTLVLPNSPLLHLYCFQSTTQENQMNNGKDQKGVIDLTNICTIQCAFPDSQHNQNIDKKDEKVKEDKIGVNLKNFNEMTSTKVNSEFTDTSEFFNNLPNLSTGGSKTSIEMKTALHGSLYSEDFRGNKQSNEMKSKESRKKKKKNKAAKERKD